MVYGGESEIRTHGRLAPTLVFKTRAINHSAISPARQLLTRELPRHNPDFDSRFRLPISTPDFDPGLCADAVALFDGLVVGPQQAGGDAAPGSPVFGDFQ